MSVIVPPSNISYGTVVWRAVSDVEDSINDSDTDPDFIAPTGTIVFVPRVIFLRNTTAQPEPLSLIRGAIPSVLDGQGYLCTPLADGSAGARGIKLIATDEADLNPTG